MTGLASFLRSACECDIADPPRGGLGRATALEDVQSTNGADLGKALPGNIFSLAEALGMSNHPGA